MPSSTSTYYNPNSIRRSVKSDSDSCCKSKIECGCESVDGEVLTSGEKGYVKQRSFVRPLTLDEQTETLIVYFERTIDVLKTDFEAKNVGLSETMDVEMKKVKSDFQFQISKMVRIEKFAELQEIQCAETLKMKEEVHSAMKLISMLKCLVVAMVVMIFFISVINSN